MFSSSMTAHAVSLVDKLQLCYCMIGFHGYDKAALNWV